MIRLGLDRINFIYLPRLWDPVDSRPFYRVTMALNRFKFFLFALGLITIAIDMADKKMIGLLLCEKSDPCLTKGSKPIKASSL